MRKRVCSLPSTLSDKSLYDVEGMSCMYPGILVVTDYLGYVDTHRVSSAVVMPGETELEVLMETET